ncbi:hypothetical protein [Rhizobium sp. NFR03]|uniref:hypothetical protein n=1 Tax=Rhizobium sp. NFR03 TaxID=1566263 RepID=UPI0008CB638F|nr:hypothetical protein [Rhizobium sp. NFR03]SES20970.1 hypothetical protein SAMN03159406_02689 [Rhizobium sp. NFR03]
MINRRPHPYLHLLPSLATRGSTDLTSDTATGAVESMQITASVTRDMVDMMVSGAAGGIACSTMANFACFSLP